MVPYGTWGTGRPAELKSASTWYLASGQRLQLNSKQVAATYEYGSQLNDRDK
jgi:hypothetical protein